MPVPDFSSGEVLTAAAMDSVGLWKVASGTITGLNTTGTNITSVFDNTKYSNYRVIFNISAVSTTSRIQFRFLSGTSQAASLYYCGGIAGAYESNTTVYFQRSNNDAELYLSTNTAEPLRFITMDVSRPHQAVQTEFSGTSSDGTPRSYYFGGLHNAATAYNGIFLFTSAGTMNVDYYIYGYRD
jgi:hypothetical protein